MSGNGTSDRPALPRTERTDAPLYLARYLERQAGQGGQDGAPSDDEAPLYLRRFRQRRAAPNLVDGPPPLPGGGNHRLVEVLRSKEIVAFPEDRLRLAATIRLVRHAETQGYSTESGITPVGQWQAHRRGFDLSKGVVDGSTVRIVCAPTARAAQTAAQVHRGLLNGLEQWGRRAEVSEPEPLADFDNFQVATPSGLRDGTAAYREYRSLMERHERLATGERPMWLVELDRFWRVMQGGGDPIHFWLTTPMLHFEPPAACVRRFWVGFRRLASESPGSLVVCVTHSGVMRALAWWAYGHDPGEPYNVEEVLIQLKEGARAALVTYRNRVQDVHVLPLESLPDWSSRSAVAGQRS